MPRLLLLVTDLDLGGTPTVVRELAVRLRKFNSGLYLHVACLSTAGPVAEQIRAAGVGVTALNAKSSRDFGVVKRLRRLIDEHQIDTVFSFLVHANTVAALVSLKRTPVRYLQSIQTTQPNPPWHWKLQRFVARRAEQIVVPSQSVARAAEEWSRVPRSKIAVIPNAIDPADFEGVQPVPIEEGRRPVPIGFIGRLDPIKRVPDLVHAVALLKREVHLHIFGSGSDRANIEAAVATHSMTSEVTFHGSVPEPQEALKQISILVLPSAAEGFGLVLIEAMAAGVPVVATDVPGIRDVVFNGQTALLVPPASPEELARAIKQLLWDRGLREKLTANALDDVRLRFTWETVLPLYQQLLGA